jgi:hypothetical protein
LLISPVGGPGFVSVLDGGRAAALIAVNPDCRRESDLMPMTPTAAAESLGLRHFRVIGEDEEIPPALAGAREGREISVPLMLAAIGAFVLELVIAQRKGGEQTGG